MDGQRNARELEAQRAQYEHAHRRPLTLKKAKGKLYDKIPFSVKTMDKIIWGLVALIIIAVLVGMALGQG